MNDIEVLNVVAWCAVRGSYGLKKARSVDLGLRHSLIVLYIGSFGLNGCRQSDIRLKFRLDLNKACGSGSYIGKLMDLGLVCRSRGGGNYMFCFLTPVGLSVYRKLLREIKSFDVGLD